MFFVSICLNPALIPNMVLCELQSHMHTATTQISDIAVSTTLFDCINKFSALISSLQAFPSTFNTKLIDSFLSFSTEVYFFFSRLMIVLNL